MDQIRKGDIALTDTIKERDIQKSAPVIRALAYMDSLNSSLGLCKIYAPQMAVDLEKLQTMLVSAMAHISGGPQITDDYTYFLDAKIKAANQGMPRQFVLPGQNQAQAHLHVARTTARLAESYLADINPPGPVHKFLNRLSLYLFISTLKTGLDKL